jgi:hypothetical protein
VAYVETHVMTANRFIFRASLRARLCPLWDASSLLTRAWKRTSKHLRFSAHSSSCPKLRVSIIPTLPPQGRAGQTSTAGRVARRMLF